MVTAFDKWLRACGAAGKRAAPLEGLLAATRGEGWADTLPLAGDWTGAVMRAYLKTNPDAPSVVANLTCSAPSVEVIDGRTISTFTLSLSSGQTANLPADTTGEGVAELALLIFLTPAGGNEELLLGTVFTVLGD